MVHTPLLLVIGLSICLLPLAFIFEWVQNRAPTMGIVAAQKSAACPEGAAPLLPHGGEAGYDPAKDF